MNNPHINFNKDLNGIELIFERKPDSQILTDIKEQGFRWHTRYKKWYAKNTPEREKFVNQYFRSNNKDDRQDESALKKKSGTSVAAVAEESTEDMTNRKPNVFASYFDSIGGDRIYKDAEIAIVDFRNQFCAGYFEKENVWIAIKNRDETIYIHELDDALESKKVAKTYCLSVGGIGFSREDKDAILYVHNELGLHKVSDLINAVKNNDFDFKNLQVSSRGVKGNDLFSPFKEVEPLKKIPDKWTKTQLVKAICSGQIYKAVCDYKYSDDYAYDSAGNFNHGKELSVAGLAQEYVEHWDGKTTSLREESREGNECVLSVYNSYSSISLYFDLDCDLKKGVEKREQETQMRKQRNDEKEQSVISLSETNVSPDRFYVVTYLEKDDNTDEYREVEELVQGINLIDYEESDKFHFAYEKTIRLEEKEIIPDRFYQVSNLFNKANIDLDDKRCIPIGNHVVLVSGQTLLEKAAEGYMIPYVSERVSCGNTFENVKHELEQLVEGKKFWCVDVSKVDYKDSLQRVCDEEQRISQLLSKDKIEKMPSLFARISEIENQRKQDGKRNENMKHKQTERV